MIRNDSPLQDRLIHNPLNVLRLDTPVPDALSGQRTQSTIRTRQARRDVDDHVPGVLVPTDMADQTDISVVRPVDRASVRVRSGGEPPLAQHALELGLQHGTHDAAAHVASGVAADQYRGGLFDVNCVGELGRQFGGPCQLRADRLGEGGVHVVQFEREKEGADEF